MWVFVLAAVVVGGAASNLGPFVVPHGTSGQRRAPTNATLSVLFGLIQRNSDEVYSRLRAVSDPTMPTSYQRYMSLGEVRELVAPLDEDVDKVLKYFKVKLPESAIVELAKSGDFVAIQTTVGGVEDAFETQIVEYGSAKFNRSTIAYRSATKLQMPTEISNLIDFVSLAAPIIDLRSNEVEDEENFIYFRARSDPTGGRSPPLVNPFKVRAAGGMATITALPFCSDGKPNLAVGDTTSVEEPCKRQGSDPIVAFHIRLYQENRPMKYLTVGYTAKRVVPCKVSPITEPASCEAVDLTIDGLELFRRTQLQIQSQTKLGLISDWSDINEVHPFWSNPIATPQMLANLYGIPLNSMSRTCESSVAIVEFLEQYFNDRDLEHFLKVSGAPRGCVSRIIGPNDPNHRGGEAQLDVQYLTALGGGNTTITFWSVPGRNPLTEDEPFIRWIYQLADADEGVPLVHSVSYGDHEEIMQEWYARRLDLEFAKMALRGLTVIVSSGDGGAIMAEDVEAPNDSCDVTRVSVPASLPSVTTVGATQLTDEPSTICGVRVDGLPVRCQEVSEKACDARTGGVITSGGGFSNLFNRPWYQTKAVERYLSHADVPLPAATTEESKKPFFSVGGRGFPDISAYGNNFLVYDGADGWKLTHGTSASAPVFAAMVGRWNDIFLQRGLAPLGFINPLLYHFAETHPEAFNDVVIGENRCGTNALKCCPTGFSASRGWDAVTGLGSPKFDKISILLEKLADEILKRRVDGDEMGAIHLAI